MTPLFYAYVLVVFFAAVSGILGWLYAVSIGEISRLQLQLVRERVGREEKDDGAT